MNDLSACEVGEINDLRTKVNFEWIIPNYFSLSQKADDYFDSPPFTLVNTKWCIRIFPNGQRSRSSVGWISLYLVLLQPVASYTLTFKLGIKDYRIVTKNEPKTSTFDKQEYVIGWDKVYDRTNLVQLMYRYSEKSTLAICCSAEANGTSVDEECQTSLDKTIYLCRDFQDLLLSGRKSDVIIKVQDEIFKLHKIILGARSSVFSKMFNYEMKEMSVKVIEISDCSPDIFQEFLQYLYTGNLKNLTRDNAIDMLVVSDKYNVTELKEQCVDFIAQDLCVDTVCDVLAVADRLHEAGLKARAEELLVQNMRTILHTEKWRSFMAENSALAAKILIMKFASDDNFIEED